MGSGMEEDYFASVRKLLYPDTVSVWEHNYKGSQYGLTKKLTCKTCNQEKDAEKFYKHPTDGYYKNCRECETVRRKAKRESKNSVGNTGNRPADPVHRKSVKPKKPEQWAKQSLSVPNGTRSRQSV